MSTQTEPEPYSEESYVAPVSPTVRKPKTRDLSQPQLPPTAAGAPAQASPTGLPAAPPSFPNTTTQGIPFAPNAILMITVWNSVASQALTFQLWYIDPNNQLQQVSSGGTPGVTLQNMTGITSDKAPNIQRVVLPSTGGTIVSFLARIAQVQTATYRGQTLVKAEVDDTKTFNGQNIAQSSTTVIVYNYAYLRKDVTFPAFDAIADPVSGRGYRHIIAPTVPIASPGGANSTIKVFTIPTNTRLILKEIYMTFAPSGGVATRTGMLFVIQDNTGTNYSYVSPTFPNLANTSNANYIGLAGYSSPADAVVDANSYLRFYIPLDLSLPQGYVMLFNISTGSNNTDKIAGLMLDVEEFLEPVS